MAMAHAIFCDMKRLVLYHNFSTICGININTNLFDYCIFFYFSLVSAFKNGLRCFQISEIYANRGSPERSNKRPLKFKEGKKNERKCVFCKFPNGFGSDELS